MPLLILHAVIACVSLITPRRTAASIQRFLTNIAVAQSTARWLATAANAQHEFSSPSSFEAELSDSNRATH